MLINVVVDRSLNATFQGKTPEELWSDEKVNVSKLKIFGSSVMVLIPKEKRRKWDKISEKLLFVGYSENTKGYRCINLIMKKITISRDVFFLEKETKSTRKMNVEEELEPVRDISYPEDNKADQETELSLTEVEQNDGSSIEENKSFESFSEYHQDDNVFDPDFIMDQEIPNSNQLRRSSRTPKPKTFDDYITFLAGLKGDLSEEIYMDQPEGFNDGSGRVCKLKRTIST